MEGKKIEVEQKKRDGDIKMAIMVSYNLAIKKRKTSFYDKADIIRLNSPWYSETELISVLENVTKPKFLDINIKERNKPKKTNHSYKQLLKTAGKYNVEWVGISNVENPETYDEIKKHLNNETTKICAKIETDTGCWHSDEIIDKFDGIMVDVEDLASNVGWEKAANEKNRIYKECEKHKKPHFRLAGVIFNYIEPNKTVYTYGAFDLLHPGHLKLLETAKTHGNKLIVGIVSDNAIKKLKGKNRPIQNQDTRYKIISSLKCVDQVVHQKEYDPTPNLKIHKPDILVKGDDWEKIPGEQHILKNGGKLIKPPYTQGYSTSDIIKQIQGLK